MSDLVESDPEEVCAMCHEINPYSDLRWDDYFEAKCCRFCLTTLEYWMLFHDQPEPEHIEWVENLSQRPYWEYIIYELEKLESHDEDTMKYLRDAVAKKRRSEFRVVG